MDELEFDDFYTMSFSRLVGQLYAMTGNFTEAQDCVQEAFVRAWHHRGKLERSQSVEAWVRTTAWRIAVSRWRRTKLSLRPADRALAPPPGPEPNVNHTALVAALKELPAEQRRAIVLHHICDLPVNAVAEETGAPVGTVKARLARGRATLATLLSDDREVSQP
jgi:RNA polymerase sigma-70 factor, ECF subfamily